MAQKILLPEVNQQWADLHIRRLSFGYRCWQEAVNVVFGSVGLIVYALFFPFVAALILIDSPGPVLYNQERIGKNGKPFLLRKFRTMYQELPGQQHLWRAKKKDAVTNVGKVLRKLHIDEFPQAWNIVRGEIHFIGPRPEWSEIARVYEKEIPFYRLRYRVKPGIIGWAQINFPPSQSVDEAKEKFEYDLYYIANQSVLLDIQIIFNSFKLFSW
jgi:lipopolysaccharide/colanic/teichoic acid biosynthesis glycosyltransferase